MLVEQLTADIALHNEALKQAVAGSEDAKRSLDLQTIANENLQREQVNIAAKLQQAHDNHTTNAEGKRTNINFLFQNNNSFTDCHKLHKRSSLL